MVRVNSEMKKNSIITVGICPCWDVTCYIDGIEWQEHKKIDTLPTINKETNIIHTSTANSTYIKGVEND